MKMFNEKSIYISSELYHTTDIYKEKPIGNYSLIIENDKINYSISSNSKLYNDKKNGSSLADFYNIIFKLIN